MSHWAKVGVLIDASRLNLIDQVCDDLGLTFNRERMEIVDPNSGHRGTLSQDGKGLRLSVDTDGHYSSLSRRFGSDMGTFMQAYSKALVTEVAEENGWNVESQTELANGSISLMVAVNG